MKLFETKMIQEFKIDTQKMQKFNQIDAKFDTK